MVSGGSESVAAPEVAFNADYPGSDCTNAPRPSLSVAPPSAPRRAGPGARELVRALLEVAEEAGVADDHPAIAQARAWLASMGGGA